MSETPPQAFKRAVDQVGGPAAAAGIVSTPEKTCSRQNIHQLLDRGSACPGEFVRRLSEASGVRRCDLRPVIFPECDEPEGPPAGWGVRKPVEPGAAELERAGQLRLLPERDE